MTSSFGMSNFSRGRQLVRGLAFALVMSACAGSGDSQADDPVPGSGMPSTSASGTVAPGGGTSGAATGVGTPGAPAVPGDPAAGGTGQAPGAPGAGSQATPGEPGPGEQPGVTPTQPGASGEPGVPAPDATSSAPTATPEPGAPADGGPAPDPNMWVYPAPPLDLADENGSDLWLRYPLVPIEELRALYQAGANHVVLEADSPTLQAAASELVRGLGGLTGSDVSLGGTIQGPGAVVIGKPGTPIVDALPVAADAAALGTDGYLVAETQDAAGQSVIAVLGNTDLGVLYGSFALLRHMQMHRLLAGLSLSASPKIQHRVLNHWDNLNGSVERGYAGRSLWDWNALPNSLSPRYEAYARANASVGINGAVLTNVNADAQVLTPQYLDKVAALADVFRPYGIAVYLTARFSAPIEIGGLNTADPTNASVSQWWADKASEIYDRIPDFGGFLVKANSEGQPGPQDYGRTHAQGANMLAQAVAPYDGIVMWRAFVYAEDAPVDRIREAYDEFKPLDGQFEPNVLVQPKNGPLDFQPREPFHPLFGAMPQTPLALELQITKEYLGQDTHLAYLGTLYEEVLQADTYADGEGSTVARVIDGSLHNYSTTAIAGVANIGSDANWTGSHFNQANWYVYGRMAWDQDLTAQAIADEWVRQTLSNDPVVVEPVTQMLMESREAVVNYMTPLGLVHIMASDHHYGPGPWVDNLGRAEWNPVYYHKANANGIGFDRTSGGSGAVEQYFGPVMQQFANRDTVPDEFLLFFHSVGWGEMMSSGRTVWQELVHRYSLGVDTVGQMRDAWASVEGRVDDARFGAIDDFLEIQHYEARWWRDACLQYFRQFGNQEIPAGYAEPANPLSFYQNLNCPPDVTRPRCTAVYTGSPSPAILP